MDDEVASSVGQQHVEGAVQGAVEGAVEGARQEQTEGRGASAEGRRVGRGEGGREGIKEEKVAVILVLGALQRWPHGQEQELQKRLERKVASRLELCHVKGVGGRSFALRSVFWPVASRGAL